MGKTPESIRLLNQAVLWHLKLCLKLLDRLGYYATAANVAAAIDALGAEALSAEEISDMDIAQEEHVRLILEMFSKNRRIGLGDDSSEGE